MTQAVIDRRCVDRAPRDFPGTRVSRRRGTRLAKRARMQQHAANIGPSIVIKGDVLAKEPISVAGRVEGRIQVESHGVTIAQGAHVEGDIIAAAIIVAGTFQGTLAAEGRIELLQTAVVDGDVAAPRLSVQDGAMLRGKVVAAGRDAS
jgi:cytoskeletal protein CcmA (bactofilin family)